MMLEDEDVLPETEGSPKLKRDEVAEGGEKSGRKMIFGLRNMDICLQCLREYKIQRGSFLKIGKKFSKKKTNGKR